MRTFRVTNRDLVYDFFRANVQLSRTDDFRGCLFVPLEYNNVNSLMEHVAVAVGYNAFNGRTCAMHAVIQKPEYVTPGVVREVFEFPFYHCGVEHLIAPVEASNIDALDFDKRLGFKEICRFKEGATVGDLILLGMSKSECRWIGKRNHNG